MAAGEYLSNRLNVPANITLMPLPPKCPELNPVGNVWQFFLGRQWPAAGYQRHDHRPRHPLLPRTSLMTSNRTTAPMVALMIAETMPDPSWMPN